MTVNETVVDALKLVFGITGFFVAAVIVAIFLLGQFPNLKLFASAVVGWFGGAGKWVRRRSLELEMEGAVNSFSKSFNRDYSFSLLPECDVQWVTAENRESVLQPGKVIVKLSFSRDDHDLNFYNAAQSFVETGLLPDTRPFLVRTTAKAIDLVMVKKLIEQGRRQALRIFNNKFAEQETAAQATFVKLAKTDEKGLFRYLFLPELHLFGQAVRQQPPTDEITRETERFVDWFYELATRPAREMTQLAFESLHLKVGVILVADTETYEKYGIRAYIRRASLYASRDFQCIYVLSRGQRRADLAVKIADKLCATGGYFLLSRRTTTVAGVNEDDVLVTCIALKPDITTIVFNAWQRLKESFAAARTVTGTVEYVTEDTVTVDVYGVNFELDRAHLSSSEIGPAYRFFERDQELELRILQVDLDSQTAELTNCGTKTDPQAVAELVEASAGQTVRGRVERIVSSRDFEVGWMLSTRLGNQSVRAFLPRQRATFSRYISLPDRYPVGADVDVRVEKFDLEHGALTCAVVGLKDPWEPLPALRVGSKINARICEVSENHATCEIAEGLEARLYYQELSWDSPEANRMKIAELAVGGTLDAIVTRFEPDRRYIAVSVKRLCKSDTELFFDEHIGEETDVRIASIGPVGATVSFPGTAFTGRLHIADIVWGYCNRLEDYVRPGDVKTVKCLEYDQWKDLIKVGIKQLEPNDFDVFKEQHEIGSTVVCKVESVGPQSVRVRVLFNGCQTFGYLHRAEVSWLMRPDERTLRHMFKPGETYHCSVKRFDPERQIVEFSRKAYLAARLDENKYGVVYRARLVFQRHETFAYGDLLEGTIIDPVNNQRGPTNVEVLLSRKGNSPKDTELNFSR